LVIPLNLNFSFFKKKNCGNIDAFMVNSQRVWKFKIKLPPVLGAIPLPIWSLICHHHMFVYPPIPTHMHQNVRIDCSNNFVSSVKICEYFFQNESSKCNQWIQWFYKNIWFKERSKITNQNPQALKVKNLMSVKISCISIKSCIHSSVEKSNLPNIKKYIMHS